MRVPAGAMPFVGVSQNLSVNSGVGFQGIQDADGVVLRHAHDHRFMRVFFVIFNIQPVDLRVTDHRAFVRVFVGALINRAVWNLYGIPLDGSYLDGLGLVIKGQNGFGLLAL